MLMHYNESNVQITKSVDGVLFLIILVSEGVVSIQWLTSMVTLDVILTKKSIWNLILIYCNKFFVHQLGY